MPKVNLKGFKEGDLLERENLVSLKTKMLEVDENIDDENIRQEGLDRRIFQNRTHSRSTSGSEFNNVYLSKRTSLPRTKRWRRLRVPDGLVNSAHSEFPEMHINWKPETDSHCIIRASFAVDTAKAKTKPFNQDDAWDFGLLIKAPETTELDGLSFFPDVGRTGFNPKGEFGDAVWPHQRMCLSVAFTRGARFGHYSWAESNDHKKLPENLAVDTSSYIDPYTVGYKNGMSITADYGPLYGRPALIEGRDKNQDLIEESFNTYSWTIGGDDAEMIAQFDEEFHPRGAWYQYSFSRQSNMNQSFTLIAHATSSLENKNNGSFSWTNEGLARVALYYRCNREVATGPEAHVNLDTGIPNLENLRMSYQIVRR
jgi:hypothetical protein